VLHPEALFYLVVVAIGFVTLIQLSARISPKNSWVLGFASSITPSDVIAQTNAERAKVGLTPLQPNTELTRAAAAKGQDMIEDQYWAHFAPDGKEPWDFMHENNYLYVAAGENLARDFSNTDEMVRAWMASATHKANITNPRYQEIGIAVIDGNFQGYETTIVVQMFGTPRQAVAQIPNDAAAAQPAPSDFSLVELANAQAPGSQGTQPAVLAGMLLPLTNLSESPIMSPLQVSKAFFLGIVMLIMITLLYDTIIVSNRSTLRFVGKNLAHILFLLTIAFLLIFFKGGIIS
jgi:hypothetical protein